MVYLEHSDGRLAKVSLEILGKAHELANKLATDTIGVIIGHNIGKLAEDAIEFGADRVLLADSPILEFYTTDAFCNVLAQLVRDERPAILLLGATYDGRDLAGRLAVRLDTGLTAHAVKLEIQNETNLLLCDVPEFGGKIVATCKCPSSRPHMVTVRPGVFPMPQRNRTGEGQVEQIALSLGEIRTKIVERSVKEGVDITGAEVVVIAGRGAEMQLGAVGKFAELIGGVVGVTRPVADKGLVPHDQQVGYTGYAISPKVAIVLGASGAAYFVSGIRGARTVISVNKDAEAAINTYADFTVIDDIEKVLPVLVSIAKGN
jgi:electron transfer flavoprotein alpha subunit